MKYVIQTFITCFLLGALTFAQEAPKNETRKDETKKGDDRAIEETAKIKVSPDQYPGFQERTPRYQLRPGDVLDIAFEFTPEFNQTMPVQPDGFITVRQLGDIHVAGMDLPHVREKLRQEYSKILREPEIRLELKEFEKPYFIAGGEVGKPGKYELRGDTTVAQAVSVAGGFTDVAKHSRVLLFRRVSTEWVEVKKINMKKMLANADLHEDLLVRPGDLIYVPVSGIGKLKASLMPRIGATIRPY